MITIRQWFKYNNDIKNSYEAYENMLHNCTIMTFTLLQPIAYMCGLDNPRVKLNTLMKEKLVEADTLKELGLTLKECKEQGVHKKAIRKTLLEIKCRYRTKIPIQLYYLSKGTDWLNDYIQDVYNKISNNIDKPCIVDKFKTYREIDNFCCVVGKVGGIAEEKELRSNVNKMKKELKEQGYSYKIILNKIISYIKTI